MSVDTIDAFVEWIDEQEELKGWTDYRLAKEAGISTSILSRARNDGVVPKWEVCVAIAEALNVPPVLAFRKAGLLPADPNIDDTIEQILHETKDLNDQDQNEVLAFIRMKNNLRQQRKKK